MVKDIRLLIEDMEPDKYGLADKYAVLLEGARRVGKSTIAEQFAINQYKSYILIDFSKNAPLQSKRCCKLV